MPIQRFEQLEAWQYAHKLVLRVYKDSKRLPADERFGLTQQIRRAAVSVPSNIAEGFKRRSSRDKAHFYNIAESSLEELRYYLILCIDLEYWTDAVEVNEQIVRVERLLGGLIRSLCVGQDSPPRDRKQRFD